MYNKYQEKKNIKARLYLTHIQIHIDKQMKIIIKRHRYKTKREKKNSIYSYARKMALYSRKQQDTDHHHHHYHHQRSIDIRLISITGTESKRNMCMAYVTRDNIRSWV